MPVGISAAEVEEIVAKAISAATAVIRDEFEKILTDLRERLEHTERKLAAIESSGSMIASLEEDIVNMAESIKSKPGPVQKKMWGPKAPNTIIGLLLDTDPSATQNFLSYLLLQ